MKGWVCPGTPQCKNWETSACEHLEAELDNVDRGRVRLNTADVDIEDVLDLGDNPDSEVEAEQVKEALDRSQSLTELQKTVLKAVFADERSSRDIGRELGIDHKAVIKAKMRGLEALRKELEQ